MSEQFNRGDLVECELSTTILTELQQGHRYLVIYAPPPKKLGACYVAVVEWREGDDLHAMLADNPESINVRFWDACRFKLVHSHKELDPNAAMIARDGPPPTHDMVWIDECLAEAPRVLPAFKGIILD